MRGNLTWSSPPATLAPLVQATKRKAKEPPQVLLQPNAFQREQVRNLLDTLTEDEQLTFLSFIRELGPNNIDEALECIEDELVESRIYLGDYTIEFDNGLMQLWCGDRCLIVGGRLDIFMYAYRYCKRAFLDIKYALANANIVDFGEIPDNIDEELAAYRMFRNTSFCMDQLSKLAQLEEVDTDSPVMKFNDPEMSAVAVHYGSGHQMGVSWLGLDAQELVCVDPRVMVTGGDPNYVKGTILSHPPASFDEECAVYSDASVGDKFGLIPMPNYAQEVAILSEHANRGNKVWCKMDISKDVGPRCHLLYKARPHNLEVIVEFDEDAPTYEEQVEGWRDDVREANNRRTTFFLGQQHLPKIMWSCFKSRHLLRYARKRRRMKIKRPIRLISVPEDRYSRLCTERRLGAVNARQSRWHNYVSSAHDPGVGPACLLPREFLRLGSFSHIDPMIGSMRYSLRSILYSADVYGIKTVNAGGWRLV